MAETNCIHFFKRVLKRTTIKCSHSEHRKGMPGEPAIQTLQGSRVILKLHGSSDTQLCTCVRVIRLERASKQQAQGQWVPPKLLIAWCLDCGPAPSSGSGTVNTVTISKALGDSV